MVANSVVPPEGLSTTALSCSRSRNFEPPNVLIKYPFDFLTARCPFSSGYYQVTVNTPHADSPACHDDKFSSVEVGKTTLNLSTCLNDNIYERPLRRMEFRCVGDLEPQVIGSAQDKGRVLILATEHSKELPNFYSARYRINEADGSVLMSLQGSIGDIRRLQPSPDTSYDSVGLTKSDFIYAFELKRVHCETGLCENGARCEDNKEFTDITCSCPPNYVGKFCETDGKITVSIDGYTTPLLEGTDLRLTCFVVDGYPKNVNFVWLFTPNSATEQQVEVSRSQTYVKLGLEVADAGAYLCQATSVTDHQHEDSVKVQVLSRNIPKPSTKSPRALIEEVEKARSTVVSGSVFGAFFVGGLIAAAVYILAKKYKAKKLYPELDLIIDYHAENIDSTSNTAAPPQEETPETLPDTAQSEKPQTFSDSPQDEVSETIPNAPKDENPETLPDVSQDEDRETLSDVPQEENPETLPDVPQEENLVETLLDVPQEENLVETFPDVPQEENPENLQDAPQDEEK